MKAFTNYAFATIGICLLIGGVYTYLNTQKFLHGTLSTVGTVVDFKKTGRVVRTNPKKNTVSYRPVVEFETGSGETIQFTSSVGANKPAYAHGDSIDVLYQQSAPAEARLAGFFSLWGMTSIFAGLGLVFLSIGLFGILNKRS